MVKDDLLEFWILAGDDFGWVSEVKPGAPVLSLLSKIKTPSEKHESMEGHELNYYTLISPIMYDDEHPLDIPKIKASLQDDYMYTKVPPDTAVRKIATEFREDFVYLVIEDLSESPEMAAAKMKGSHPDLYRCLEITVQAPNEWRENDIGSNGGIFVGDGEQDTRRPPAILDLEGRLSAKRTFDMNTDGERDLSCARSFERQFSSSYVQNAQARGTATVKDSKEFAVFYKLLHCYIPVAWRYRAQPSSSLKAHALTENFILPPFFFGPAHTRLVYNDKMPWKFPLLVLCPPIGAVSRRYTPVSDICILFQQFDLPLVIFAVMCDRYEEDRNRMLLQAIALARLAFHLRQPGSTMLPYIVAIYLTAGMTAERYIVMKMESASNEVYISKKSFELTNINDAAAFQCEMYNLASDLKSILGQLDTDKLCELEAITKQASGLMSLHFSNDWTLHTPVRTPHSSDEDSSDEERKYSKHRSEVEEDLGVFGDQEVYTVLKQMKYKVAWVAWDRPNIALIVNRGDGELAGCLKFVKSGGKSKEVEILQYLAGLRDKSNHTVRPMRIWPITGGWVIAMPPVGNRLTALTDPTAHLWPLAMQLFEAVKFMHDHNVAHLDLKPANILIPSEYGRLTIVDFGVSFRLRDAAQLLRGQTGTPGYIAPEVDGHTDFSPIRADLWSTGKIVQDLCMLCRPSPARNRLLALSEQLLDDDPSKRPMMSEVLQWMSNGDAGETLDAVVI